MKSILADRNVKKQVFDKLFTEIQEFYQTWAEKFEPTKTENNILTLVVYNYFVKNYASYGLELIFDSLEILDDNIMKDNDNIIYPKLYLKKSGYVIDIFTSYPYLYYNPTIYNTTHSCGKRINKKAKYFYENGDNKLSKTDYKTIKDVVKNELGLSKLSNPARLDNDILKLTVISVKMQEFIKGFDNIICVGEYLT